MGKSANSGTAADHIVLQNGTVYVNGRLVRGTTQLPQGPLEGDPEYVNAFLFKLVPEARAPTNTPPDAQDDAYTFWKYYTLTVPTFEGVLRNDSNPNLDSLTPTVVSPASHGKVDLRPDGSFEYMPDYDNPGQDSFQYKVDNGKGGFDIATVSIVVKDLAPVTLASADVPKGITDLSTKVTTSQLVLNYPFVIADLHVAIDITHPRTPDMDVFLVGPDSTRVELFTDVGTTKSANFTGTILDDARAEVDYQRHGSLWRSLQTGRPAICLQREICRGHLDVGDVR